MKSAKNLGTPVSKNTSNSPLTAVPVRISISFSTKEKPLERRDAEITLLGDRTAYVECSSGLATGQEIFIQMHGSDKGIYDAKVTGSQIPETKPDGGPLAMVLVKNSVNEKTGGFAIEFSNLKPDRERALAKVVQYFRQLQGAGVNLKR